MPFIPDTQASQRKSRFVPDAPAQPDTFAGDDLLSNEAMAKLVAGAKSTVTPSPEPSAFRDARRYLSNVDDAVGRLNRAPGTGGLGTIEAAGTLLTGGLLAPVLGTAESIAIGTKPEESFARYTYQPRTESGKAQLDLLGALTKPVSDSGADMALLPLAAESQAINAIPRSPRVPRPEPARPATTAQEVMARMQPQDSVGAASAARGVTDATPELQQAIVKMARKSGGAINPKVLDRHMDADTLPVPVRITEGHATQNPTLISQEMNLRGQSKEMTDRFNEINSSLGENIKVMRDEAGPDVFTTNATEHGDTLIAAYKARDEAVRADIKAKYKALADANGGNLPVNGKAFVAAASEGLKKQMKAPFLPPPIKKILVGVRKGEPMTIETVENLRTALAAEGRKADRAGDGNAAAAVSIVRDALESMPIQGASAQVKQLADAARSASRQRFEALRADPAYKAAVEDSVTPDRFVQKFIIGAPRDQVSTLSQAMAGNDQALQTIQVAVLDHLRDAARLNPHYEGNFAAASYNKALKQLDPKLRHLLPASAVENVEKLGRVAGYATSQPKGSFVNNSNSFVAAAADYGKSAAEGATNVAFGGVPVGTWGRRLMEGSQRKRQVRNSLAPGAGLGMLDEAPPNSLRDKH